MPDVVFLNKEKFSKEVEDFVVSHQTTVLEAIVHKITEKGMEFEMAKKYLTHSLVEKLEVEAQEMKLVKKTEQKKNTLPL